MKKIINNRIIAFVVYLVFFLLILFMGTNQDSILRFVFLSFYCDLVVYIQSKTRNIKNKELWYIYMFLFSPIAFPLFLISDKKYFKKISIIGGINIAILIMVVYLWGQTTIVYDSLTIWDKSDVEIQKIDQQYTTVDFNNLTEESGNFIINLSNNKIKELNTISNAVKTIQENVFIKLSTEQSEYYKKWSDSLEKQTSTMNKYIGIFEAIKEKKSVDDVNKLTADWKIEDEKITKFEIKAPESKPVIIESFKSVNQMSVLFSLVFFFSIINIIAYIKLFSLKTWKLKIIFGLNTIVNLLLLSSLFLIGYF